jgi:hypothetical protein
MIISDINWSGYGAILLGIAGIVSAWIALRKAKEESSYTCHERLNASRIETEYYATVLHNLLMKHPDLSSDIPLKPEPNG